MQRKLVRPYLSVLSAQAQTFLVEARADLDRLNDQHARELAALLAEVSELRGILHDVVAVLREQANQDVATLRRELERALIKLAPRDGRPLH